ncbi:DUF418 domain-containing protein [Macrococcoides caseolyticum]|uniref:DUF418 domain-containing protein n=1 Tax=Macrococcoides caseolyticum TaxID=69966 RepID=UPI001F3F0D95|nr:DUF418 domain-containing protein [Macrococcus caseolyticus]MCE4956422.1 DUF418 domain-containing protein [Macrococcus caseolyticus]
MKRITIVDSLRGLSLIGILLANLLIFQFGNFGASYPDFYHLDPLSKGLLFIDQVFIHGSFMPIFVLLFGFGLVKMSDSLARRHLPVKRALVRRGCMLFIFGLLHATYLFSGDILYLYGMITLILFWLAQRSTKTMYIVMAISIILCGGLILSQSNALKALSEIPMTETLTKAQAQYLEKEIQVNAHGTLDERNAFFIETEDPFLNLDEHYLTVFFISIFFYLPFFIVGMLFARHQFFETDMTKAKRILMYLTPVFLILKALFELNPMNEMISVLAIISNFGLSFSYIALFYYLYHRYHQAKIFKGFEAVGKLSLTNYIGQSVFHGFIYYSHGFSRFGDSNFTLSIIIALVFFGIQILFSISYLKYFKYGPLEYIIRVVTYWSFHPRKKMAS